VSRALVAPIVEGHGEQAAAPLLIRRIWTEILGSPGAIEVLQPIRQPRGRLVTKPAELERAVRLAGHKLAARAEPNDQQAVLLLLDADEDPACSLGPGLRRSLDEAAMGRVSALCVLAVVEYETWFVGAARSLASRLAPGMLVEDVADPEGRRLRKKWIAERLTGRRYSETLDQPALTALMDLATCRARCPSFDKLCRELSRLAPPRA